ncbi:biotin--[acetyl-CoA-carboxylase] ligase [Pseudoruegeria sp. SK021]|uniref:biotin--[acetyl-CoA-carboxylase] ligase n=1 Tax=Pseudoruegeria sp. SK021 TaxID=1933035 RepID=UPI000A26174E|nr:biotin--[acetyl-CoA-carboxylase] ligase [Pseudoruegeria sp. SK021]OSP54537.1 biotin--[acetyl-CoA-carboxylase] ligase [Pseudoruegeria sp. SK021]
MSSKTPAWPDGVGRRVLAEVDSTNAEAARIGADLAGPTWILALRQTAGKGRRGRPWADPVGNFAATYISRPTTGPEGAALRSFVAALALADAVSDLSGRADAITLKWPNDVLMNGQKLAGILLEYVGAAGHNGLLSIGIGVNLINSPDVTGLENTAFRPTSVLDAAGVQIDPETLLDHLAPAFARWEAQLDTFGFDPIRTAFLARAARLGEVITARTGREELTGTFESIDQTGALVLVTASGRISVPAADIFF